MSGDTEKKPDGPGVFARFARSTAGHAGSPWAFILAAGVVIAWAVSGPIFQFSSTWQLVINTGTTIVTFLMVFLIQNSQNRDSQAMQLKLDALIDAFDEVRDDMIDVEEASEDEIKIALEEYRERRRQAQADNAGGRPGILADSMARRRPVGN